MSAKDLTPWFPADVKPVHIGRYEVRNFPPVHQRNISKLRGKYRWWDGICWWSAKPGYPWAGPTIMGTHESHQWRGLASPGAQEGA